MARTIPGLTLWASETDRLKKRTSNSSSSPSLVTLTMSLSLLLLLLEGGAAVEAYSASSSSVSPLWQTKQIIFQYRQSLQRYTQTLPQTSSWSSWRRQKSADSHLHSFNASAELGMGSVFPCSEGVETAVCVRSSGCDAKEVVLTSEECKTGPMCVKGLARTKQCMEFKCAFNLEGNAEAQELASALASSYNLGKAGGEEEDELSLVSHSLRGREEEGEGTNSEVSATEKKKTSFIVMCLACGVTAVASEIPEGAQEV